MTKDLAKTITTALVQFIDRERPEGTMCCSNAECESIEQMFEGGCYDVVESLIKKKLSRLTEFQNAVRVMITEALTTHIKDGNGREMSSTVFIDDNTAILLAAGLLELAKNELKCKNVIWLKDDNYDPLDNSWELGSVGLGHKGYYIPYSDLLKLPKEE